MLRKYATSFSICFCFATDGVFFVRRFSTKFSAFFPFITGVFLMICAIRLILRRKNTTILFGCQDFFGYLFIQISLIVLLLGVGWGNGVIIYSFRFKSNLTLLFSAGESASLLSADLNTRII